MVGTTCAFSGAFQLLAPELLAPALIGHALGQVATGIWVFGAIATFDASASRFLGGTIGLAPIRFGVVLGGVALGVMAKLALMPFVLSLVGTAAFGLLIDVWIFLALGKAAEEPQLPSGNGVENQ